MKIDDIYINYIEYGEKNARPFILLHGWGQNIEMMKPLGNAFKHAFRIIIVDLPGFGKSEEPPYGYSTLEYADLLHKLFTELKVKDPIMIGHSFGGSVAISYASKYDVCKLILLASPFEKTEKKSFKVFLLKTLKKIPFLNKLEDWAKNHIGSVDYRNASKVMKEVLVKRVNCNLTEEAKKINCPTLLIWGRNDTAVPVEEAMKLEKLIKDAGLVIYEKCTHYAYLEELTRTINVLDKFLEKESEGNYEN